MDEIIKKDTAIFTAIPAVVGASRVTTPAEDSQRSWETPALPYLLLIEDSPEYTLTTGDSGFGILIA
jgi:hypothetical protein